MHWRQDISVNFCRRNGGIVPTKVHHQAGSFISKNKEYRSFSESQLSLGARLCGFDDDVSVDVAGSVDRH